MIIFEDIRWLRELARPKQRNPVPELIGRKLQALGLAVAAANSLAITAKGRIALAKFG
jgi:hypothetical protein